MDSKRDVRFLDLGSARLGSARLVRSCPPCGRENILGVFLAVPRVVGENILGVFLDSKRDFGFEKGREFENIDFFKKNIS